MPRNRIAKRCRLFLQIAALSAIGTMVSAQEPVPAHLDYFGTGSGSTIVCPPDPCPPNPCPPGVPMLQSPQMVPPSMNNEMRIGDTQPNAPVQRPSTPGSQPNPGTGETTQPNNTQPNNTQPTQPQTDPNSNFNFDQNNDTSPLSQPTNNQPTPDFSRAGVGNFGAGGISSLALADNPNVMGDLLQGSRNISFFYNLAGDGNGAYSGGGALARNSKISDNNSPIPRTRMHFRYHLFGNGAAVDGLQPIGPLAGSFPNRDISGEPFGTLTLPGGLQQVPVASARRELNTHLLEYGFEQKIGDLHSLEFRIPMLATLDSTVHFDATDSIDGGGNSLFGLAMPGKTRGNYDFELRDLSLITKSVLLYSDNYVLSAGLGIRLPTSRTSNIRISDGVNAADRGAAINPTNGQPQATPDSYVLGGQETFLVITDFRDRYIKTDYQTVALTPYLSLGTGSKKSPWFTNSFGSIETPIGQDEVTYNEVFQDAVGTRNPVTGVLETPTYAGLLQSASIQDQSLLAIDLSVGRWLINRPRGGLLRKLALISELHYTTTLNDADNARFSSMIQGGRNQRIDLPFDPSLDLTIIDPVTGNPAQLNGYTTPNEPETIVGNTANRLDILNATVGTFMQFGDHVTFNTGVGLPLRDGDDRLFDYELQFQLNYYIDGFGGRNPAF